jgi:hypothetical protein
MLELAALPIVPLADRTTPFASLNDKQPVFLPTPEQVQGGHQYEFQKELRLVCSDFLACLDPAGNSVLGVMLKRMGAKVLSEYELVHTHIVPALASENLLEKAPSMLASYLAFLHKYYMRLSLLEKDALAQALTAPGQGVVLPTSHGLCRVGDDAAPVHFSNEVGQLDLGKLSRSTSSFVWRVVDMNELWQAGDPRVKQDRRGWEEFLRALGVTDFFQVLPMRTQVAEQQDSPWRGETQWKSAGPFTVLDHASPELESLLKGVGAAGAARSVLLDDGNSIADWYQPNPGEPVLAWLRRVQAGRVPVADGTLGPTDAGLPPLDSIAINELVRGREVYATYSGTHYQADKLLFRLSPASKSDFNESSTYAAYVSERYKVKEPEADQPMLRCVLSKTSIPLLIPQFCCFQEGITCSRELFAQMKALCCELNIRWQDLAAFQSAKVFPQLGAAKGISAFDAPSSLTLALRRNAWMPSTDPWALATAGDGKARRIATFSLMPPRLCYIATKEISDLLGPQSARFADVATLDLDFAAHVGTLCKVYLLSCSINCIMWCPHTRASFLGNASDSDAAATSVGWDARRLHDVRPSDAESLPLSCSERCGA